MQLSRCVPWALVGLWVSGGSGCGSSLTPQDEVVGDLCRKFESCGQIPSGFQAECQTAFKPAVIYMIDPVVAGACLESASCQRLESEGDKVIAECLDLDMQSFDCQGTTSLHYCNNKGACVDLECRKACDWAVSGVKSSSCGFVEKDQHDKCICTL